MTQAVNLPPKIKIYYDGTADITGKSSQKNANRTTKLYKM